MPSRLAALSGNASLIAIFSSICVYVTVIAPVWVGLAFWSPSTFS